MPGSLYPSYMDLDPLIDVQRLKELDSFVTERLERRLAAAADALFHTGPFTLEAHQPHRPGSRMVYLSRSREAENYYDLDRTTLWQPTPEAQEFAPLMEFIATLPFTATGRMLIMYDANGSAVTAHKDHDDSALCHEFIWLRTNRSKPFYMLNSETGERAYVSGHSAWFDTVNQFHGADESGDLSFSIRVDGVFDDEFRRQIPFSALNRASTPSIWAKQAEDISPASRELHHSCAGSQPAIG